MGYLFALTQYDDSCLAKDPIVGIPAEKAKKSE